jgi:hypothetical protein
MLQLLRPFLQQGWQVTYASTATDAEHAADLDALGIESVTVRVNDAELPTQPFNLPDAQAELTRCLRLSQPALQHAAQNLQSVQLLGAHRQASRIVHVDLPTRHGA